MRLTFLVLATALMLGNAVAFSVPDAPVKAAPAAVVSSAPAPVVAGKKPATVAATVSAVGSAVAAAAVPAPAASAPAPILPERTQFTMTIEHQFFFPSLTGAAGGDYPASFRAFVPRGAGSATVALPSLSTSVAAVSAAGPRFGSADLPALVLTADTARALAQALQVESAALASAGAAVDEVRSTKSLNQEYLTYIWGNIVFIVL